jgi:hypothetical protein
MIKESYIVAFRAGSSGRFISNILYGILTESEGLNFKLSQYNSTHLDNKHGGTFKLIDIGLTTPSFASNFSNKNFYKNFIFKEDPGIVHTHVPPQYSTIKNRYPETKIVIISFTENEQAEIIYNSFLKNGLEDLENNKFKPNNPDSRLFCKLYFKFFGEHYTGQSLSINQKQQILLEVENCMSGDPMLSYYKNPIISEDYVDKTLVIHYDDIIHNPDKIIDKLQKFSGKTHVDISMRQYYNAYLDGRKKLIEQHMPWVKP